jgi:hypothetical protein
MAGELITADGQFELRALLFGEGTNIINRPGSPKGLGTTAFKTNDVALGHADGSYGGPEYRGVRLVTWELSIHRSSGDEAMTDALAINAAFDVSSVDLELHGQLPTLGRFYLNGRPRGATLIPLILNPQVGHIEMMCEFAALDPTIYDPDES